MNPELNELVTINVDFRAEFDMVKAQILLFSDKEGMELVEGASKEEQNIRKGEMIKRTYKLKFVVKQVIGVSILIFEGTPKGGYAETLVYYVAGAFDEDARVRQMRDVIASLKHLLNDQNSDTHVFPDGFITCTL